MENRILKFRCFYRGEMYFVYDMMFNPDGSYGVGLIVMGDGMNVSPDSEHIKGIMQFTGLHDKNGKEIYEGDLLKDDPSPMIVQWDHRLACFGLERKGWAFTHFFQEAINSDKCEVIGNIHEHPDLLSPSSKA